MLVNSSYTADIILITVIVLLLLLKYLNKNQDYWKKKNVPGPSPKPIIGNLWNVLTFKSSLAMLLQNFYESTTEPFVGIYSFSKPALVVRDPGLTKLILSKDFKHFKDRIILNTDFNELFDNILFVQKNPEWQTTRKKLSPLFSPAQIKGVFDVVVGVCEQMIYYINSNPYQIETEDLTHRFSTETITQAFFGVEGQCFEREDSEIRKHTKAIFAFTLRDAVIQSLYFLRSSLVYIFKLNFFQDGLESFFRETIWKYINNSNEMKCKTAIRILRDMRNIEPRFGKYYTFEVFLTTPVQR